MFREVLELVELYEKREKTLQDIFLLQDAGYMDEVLPKLPEVEEKKAKVLLAVRDLTIFQTQRIDSSWNMIFLQPKEGSNELEPSAYDRYVYTDDAIATGRYKWDANLYVYPTLESALNTSNVLSSMRTITRNIESMETLKSQLFFDCYHGNRIRHIMSRITPEMWDNFRYVSELVDVFDFDRSRVVYICWGRILQLNFR